MMKKLYFTFLFICTSIFFSYGQTYLDSLNITVYQMPYKNINSSYVCLADTFWVDSSYKKDNNWCPILLNEVKFNISGEMVNLFAWEVYKFRVGIYSNNHRILHYPANAYTREFSDTPPYQTKFSSVTDTVDGQMVYKYELKDVGLADSNYLIIGKLNQQYWFYDDGTFEIHYGECYSSNHQVKRPTNNSGHIQFPVIAYSKEGVGYRFMAIYGDYLNPTYKTGNTQAFFDSLSGQQLSQIPPSGTVYRFSNIGKSGIANAKINEQVHTMPSPFTNQLQVSIKNKTVVSVTLYTLNGVEVGQWQTGMLTNLGNLPSGVYLVKTTATDGSTGYTKVVKQ